MNEKFMGTGAFLQLFADEPEQESINLDANPDGEKTGDKKDEPAPKYTDEDVNNLIEKKFAEWQKKQKKAVDEASKLAEMNAQQKAEYERDKLQKQLEEYEKKESLAGMTKTARKMLSDEGVTVSEELLTMMVSPEADVTKAAVDGFVEAFNKAVDEAVKAKLKGEPPKKGSGTTTMTKEQIMAIKDPELRQKKMIENRELFNF